ncbi:membrane glycosyltransferase [Spiribacter vilamensis]|uniref:Glucans biosynthesis glucosyltransferase H n=2 Tax=Spiribacter vilamensis TaxID=531306 RepID=A0A4V2GIY6_9GAMM|nr:membrane glycosyltransferase [Spiribacter vilamensis]
MQDKKPTDQQSTWALSEPGLPLRRAVMGALAIATSMLGIHWLWTLLQPNGVGGLEWLVIAAFSVTFSVSCVAFWTMLAGILLRLAGRHPVTLRRELPSAADAPPLAKTALVMPAYNEDMADVVHCLMSTLRSLHETGESDWFDCFLLSDSSDPAQREREREGMARLQRHFPDGPRLYYRARDENTGRKPGNIRDFCERWGAGYEYMIVLDADSRMTGDAILTLVRRMVANPQAGIIQTVPLPVGQRTVLGRFQQLAASLHARHIANGLAFWQGNSTNYWGHNAIIRIADFQACCGLSPLPGRPPLGGDIMSHDYVEAGLMRRHGRSVYVLPEIGGSFEGMPGNFVDDLKRERRWCQGNLQHLRLLTGRGWRPVTRLNFLLGGLAYVTAPLWLMMIGAGVLDAVLTTGDGRWVSAATSAPQSVINLVGLSLIILFLPRLIGIALAVLDNDNAGRRLALLRGSLLELGFGILRSPLMMVLYTGFILRILAGRPARWDTSLRGRRRIPALQAWRLGGPVAGGTLVVALVVAITAPRLLPWLLPALAGPMLFPLFLQVTSLLAPAWLPATPAESRRRVPMNPAAVGRTLPPPAVTLCDTPREDYRPMPLQPLSTPPSST